MSIFRRKDDPPGPDDRPEDDAVEPPAAAEPPRAPVPTPRGTIVPRPLGGGNEGLGGRIVTPRNGDTLSGVVDVEVQAAELDGDVQRIEVEYSADGNRWRSVGSVQDEPYDLLAVIDAETPALHVAVIRSWRLAQYFRLVLEGQPELGFERVDVRSSDAQPWDVPPRPGATWNTNGLGDGTYRLRARTVGPGGAGVLTPEVAVTVDNRAPDVRLVEPAAGADLDGTVALIARAEDAGSRVEQLTFEYSRDAGETWQTIAAREEAPWEAEWDVADVPATDVLLRVRALDSHGHEQVGSPVRASIAAAAPQIELGPLPPQLRGRVELSAAVDRPELVEEVEFQLAEEEGDAWLTVASAAHAPYAAPFDSTVLADGRYEVRATAVARRGRPSVTDPRPHRIDNTPPIVRLDVPANGFVAGTVDLEARAHDEGSGIDSIVIELRPEDGRWSELARADEAPALEHTWDTSALDDGHYEMRVVARDRAGNERRPELVALVVDNTAPLAELVEPTEGERVGGIVPIGAEIVDSCSGLAWLRYEWAGEDGEWHELPRGAGSVTWQTAEVEDGEYRLRVRAADRAGNTTTSDEVGVLVENAARIAARAAAEALAARELALEDDTDVDAPAGEEPTRFGAVPSWTWQDDDAPADEPAAAAERALEQAAEAEHEPTAEEPQPERESEPEGEAVAGVEDEPDEAEPEIEDGARDDEDDAEDEDVEAAVEARPAARLAVVPPPAEPDPEPEPEPEPERDTQLESDPAPDPDPEPAGEVVSLPRGARRWDLWELDRLVEEHPEDDRAEERRAVLYFLRDHAALDGTIPPELEGVVVETFGDLLG